MNIIASVLTCCYHNNEEHFRKSIYEPIFLKPVFEGTKGHQGQQCAKADDGGDFVCISENVFDDEDYLVQGGLRI